MEKIKWNRLIRAIQNEGTVLFIGPNVEKNENGQPVFQQLCRNMVEDYKDELSYDEKEGFLFFIDPKVKSEVAYDLKEYYEEHDFATDIYSKIAAIPIHLIVSLSPDDAIHHAFRDNGVEHDFVYFEFVKREIEEPTKEKPLIYSLLGLATKSKYILSEEDYFNYIKLVDSFLPDNLKYALSSASNYIFIGFDFEKWYIRLLLRLLNFHEKKEEKTCQAIQAENMQELYKQLAEKQFNICFVENDEVDFFTTFYSKINEKGLLRPTWVEKLLVRFNESGKLLDEYEEKYILTDDPREKLRLEKEITVLKEEIAKIKEELIKLKDGQ